MNKTSYLISPVVPTVPGIPVQKKDPVKLLSTASHQVPPKAHPSSHISQSQVNFKLAQKNVYLSRIHQKNIYLGIKLNDIFNCRMLGYPNSFSMMVPIPNNKLLPLPP